VDVTTLQIKTVARQVMVSGKRHLHAIESASTVWHNIPNTQFSQELTLSGEIDGDKAEAHYDRGILTIRMSKVAHLRPKSFPVLVVQ
jgi:HSP20 family protein